MHKNKQVAVIYCETVMCERANEMNEMNKATRQHNSEQFDTNASESDSFCVSASTLGVAKIAAFAIYWIHMRSGYKHCCRYMKATRNLLLCLRFSWRSQMLQLFVIHSIMIENRSTQIVFNKLYTSCVEFIQFDVIFENAEIKSDSCIYWTGGK